MIEPCFPGGTSSAIAAELDAIAPFVDVEVHGLTTAMFPDRRIAPQLGNVLLRLGIPLHLDSHKVTADTIIFHNPSCLKFQETLNTRMIANHLIVVTHENFLRPGDAPAFDVEKCLGLIASQSLALVRSLAPVSAHNRSTVNRWMQSTDAGEDWQILGDTWFNICLQDRQPPTPAPQDRRGRLSRPGMEKFPSQDVLRLCFPKAAQRNVILGADHMMQFSDTPPHWTLLPFGAVTVEQFFKEIDFFVYYTAPTWRESFGRVIAEAVSAGKIAITDQETARGLNGAAIGAPADQVTDIIAGYLADPGRYCADVERFQSCLDQFSPSRFASMFRSAVMQTEDGAQ